MIFKSRRLSISKKLTLIYSAILLSILIVFTLLTFFSIRNLIIRDNEASLASSTDMICNYIISTKSVDQANLNKMNLSQGVNFCIFDKYGSLIYSNRQGPSIMEKHQGKRGKGFGREDFDHDRENVYMDRTVNINGTDYYVQVAKGFEDIGAKTGTLAEILVITGLLGTLVAFISGSFLSKKLLKPIQDITNTAKEITSKSLDKRIAANGADDEIKDLADTFNAMIERLERDFEKQRRFVSDASHELRTPLSVIHGHVNMLNRWGKDDPEVLKSSLSTLKSETENMNRLIENLLYLAKGDNNVLTIAKEEFSVSTLLKEVIDETLLNHSEYNISADCEDKLIIKTDYNALKQVLRILMDNSLKFSTPPGEIKIDAEKEEKGVSIIVQDKGVGIPSESLPYIFDRFYRVDESRTKATGGSGLGLSIAKQIVTSLNGRISAQSELGKGTKFTVFIPFDI
jgi:two-component system sensor histidine kinase ArlS